MSSPLVFPAPPPPPGSISRPVSSASTIRATSVLQPPPPPAMSMVEPTIDDLMREIHELQTLVASVSTNCLTLVKLRDSIIVASGSAPSELLLQLSSLTTSTGSLILSLSTDLQGTTSRLSHLRALADAGTAAALPTEVSQLEEHFTVVSLEASQGVERIRKLAWEEVDQRESARRRLEERIRRENVQMGEEGVEMAVRQAFVGAEVKVAQLDPLSYAGRVALESPFTELATLIDDAKEEHASLHGGGDLARTNTQFSAATTLVGSQYGKLEGAEDEEQLLAPKGVGSTLLGDIEKAGPGIAEGKMNAWRKLKLNWRDYLQKKENESNDPSSSAAVAAASGL
ncbi:hypothetical protein JCM11641_002258 [Rhodosporidiobolus odoratus]